MKSAIILCCIALTTAHKGGYGYSGGPWSGFGGGIGGYDFGGGFAGGFGGDFGGGFSGGFGGLGGATVVAGPTSIGFGRGHAVSTPRGTVSTAVGKGIGTAPHNAGQVVHVGPISSVTGPLGSNHLTPGYINGKGPQILDFYRGGYGGYGGPGLFGGGLGFGGGFGVGPYGYGLDGFGGGGYGFGVGGYGGYNFGPGGYSGFPSRDVVGSGVSAAISARGNAAANAVGARVSRQGTSVSSSGTGRPVWTPWGPGGVADSGSTSATGGFGTFPFGGFDGFAGGGFGGPSFGGGYSWGGMGGPIGGYYGKSKKY